MSPGKYRERRRSPRPPLWLNLLLLVLAFATFAYARHQRDVIDDKIALLFKPSPASPAELNRIRDELSKMDLTKAQLARELDARLEFLQTVNSDRFYIIVDSAKQKFYLRLGDDVVREANATIGENVKKGAFNVRKTDRADGYAIVLPNSDVIHSRAGSITVPEADLSAIWPRITNRTRVYIF